MSFLAPPQLFPRWKGRIDRIGKGGGGRRIGSVVTSRANQIVRIEIQVKAIAIVHFAVVDKYLCLSRCTAEGNDSHNCKVFWDWFVP
jgi:hypothetical protein